MSVDVDLYDPRTWEAGVPHAELGRLRREAPVSFHPEADGPGFWAVVRHADVTAVLRDPATWSSWLGGVMIEDPEPPTLEVLRQMMLDLDPPEHTKMRLLVNKAFTPRHVEGLKGRIHELAVEIVDRVADRGACDFVEDVAGEMPLFVIAEILGIPVQDRKLLFSWTERMHSTATTDEERHSSAAALGEMFAYAASLAAEKRARPTDDLVSVLLAAEVDGHRLTELEFQLFFLLLVNAGGDTTRNLVAGGVLTLLEHPAAFAELLADPALLPPAIEELLRFVTPVIQFRRTARHDAELAGQRIEAGDKVVVFYVSANRDEAVFADPDRLDLRRSPNPHLSFGVGPHFCLGASLARLEIRELLTQVLWRLGDLELAGPVVRQRSNFIHGILEMPVRFSGR